MNNRLLNNSLFPLLLFLCLPVFGSAQEAMPKGFLDRIEENLQSAWQSFWGIAKTESDNIGQLAARGTGAGASTLSFWNKHPKVFKILLGSVLFVTMMRGQQYVSVKEHLDKARVFCASPVPGSDEPASRAGWLVYNREGSKNDQIAYCNLLIQNLASSSWLNRWLPELAQVYLPNLQFDVANEDHVNQLLSIQAVKDIVRRRSAALGSLQYRYWLSFFGTWKERIQATWHARNEVNCLKSIGTALIFPYDGEATMLTFKLLEIKRALQARAY